MPHLGGNGCRLAGQLGSPRVIAVRLCEEGLREGHLPDAATTAERRSTGDGDRGEIQSVSVERSPDRGGEVREGFAFRLLPERNLQQPSRPGRFAIEEEPPGLEGCRRAGLRAAGTSHGEKLTGRTGSPPAADEHLKDHRVGVELTLHVARRRRLRGHVARNLQRPIP